MMKLFSVLSILNGFCCIVNDIISMGVAPALFFFNRPPSGICCTHFQKLFLIQPTPDERYACRFFVITKKPVNENQRKNR